MPSIISSTVATAAARVVRLDTNRTESYWRAVPGHQLTIYIDGYYSDRYGTQVLIRLGEDGDSESSRSLGYNLKRRIVISKYRILESAVISHIPDGTGRAYTIN